MEAIAGPLVGSVVGGLMGGDGGGESQTATKDPWEPARKPLMNTLNTGQDLERYYQQNPFNRLQQQGYQNLFSDLDQFRSQVAPGLMAFSNDMMGYNYQRGPRNSQVEQMGYGKGVGMPMQGNTRPQLMQQGPDGAYTPQAPQGLLSAGQTGPFPMPAQGNYGLLDFRELNPFTATNGIPPAPAPAAPAPVVDPANKPYDWRDDLERIMRGGNDYTGAGA